MTDKALDFAIDLLVRFTPLCKFTYTKQCPYNFQCKQLEDEKECQAFRHQCLREYILERNTSE